MTSYKDAGVDIEKADRLVQYIKNRVRENFGEAFDQIGAFAGGLKLKGYRNPVIFTTTDGVGTKLKIAQDLGVHKTVGIDLVAMNVNDVVTTGAKPLLFLDYIATGKIKEEVIRELIDGIIEGCRLAGCVLAGGETAEMPGFYPEGVYDLAGFCIGVVEEEEVIDTSKIGEGDILIGLRSNGFHSNGFSLIRKVLRDKNIVLTESPDYLGSPLGEILLKPTAIYVQDVIKLRKEVDVKGIAHITGGGIAGNLVRILPEGVKAIVELSAINVPPEMVWLSSVGRIPQAEMLKTFNMGVGMILVVAKEETEKALSVLGDKALKIGHIERGKKGVEFRGTFQN